VKENSYVLVFDFFSDACLSYTPLPSGPISTVFALKTMRPDPWQPPRDDDIHQCILAYRRDGTQNSRVFSSFSDFVFAVLQLHHADHMPNAIAPQIVSLGRPKIILGARSVCGTNVGMHCFSWFVLFFSLQLSIHPLRNKCTHTHTSTNEIHARKHACTHSITRSLTHTPTHSQKHFPESLVVL
jgi:hypothetical protein